MTSEQKTSVPTWEDGGMQGAPGQDGLDPEPGTRKSPPASSAASGRASWKRVAVFAAIGVIWLIVAAAGAIAGLIETYGPPPLGRDLELSRMVLDRNGTLLRAYLTSEGRWRLSATPSDVDPRYLEALFAYEDKRFFDHRGVDPLAMGRAAFQFIAHGHIVSGGSTLTMQVARLLEPRQRRSLGAKLRQAVRAVQLERALSKDEILGLYLTLAPYGGNLEGVRAASLAYFGKEPRRLTLGQTALLVALPQAPEARRPDRFPETAKQARNRVLDRIAGQGLFSDAEIAQAKKEPVPSARMPMPLLAPHAADQALSQAPEERMLRLTIDGRLQKTLERLARERAHGLGADLSVAMVVIDNATGEVLARVASPDYFDERRAGQVDLTQAVRSPGSTLKPFIYGLGFEDGLVHPETLIDDRPIHYPGYQPKNFDLTFQGTVTVRRALQLSLNVPAVAVLDAVGASRLAARLGGAGASLILPRREAPGLALGLGGVGVRLTDLTMLYTGFPRLGTVAPLVERLGAEPLPPRRLLEPSAAWSVANVLIGTPPPEHAAGGRIAYKTGTSYGYRDAWAVGFDGKRTIGVWAGRPDGAPVVGLTGRSAAAPMLFDAFARLPAGSHPLPAAPKGALIATTAKLPPPLQRFSWHSDAGQAMVPKLQIVFPPDGASLELSGQDGDKLDPMAIKISGGTPPLNVLLNGLPLGSQRSGRTLFFDPGGPGFIRLTVTDATGAADSVAVRLQ
jgi:penicillin-binding protein 1C